MLEVKDRKDMILPACSLQFDENVYFMERVNYLFVLIDMIDRHNMELGRSK